MTVARSPGEHAEVVEHRSSADYIDRTIATVRNHREADNCWPQWANIFADEIEDLRADVAALVAVAEDATRQAGEAIEALSMLWRYYLLPISDEQKRQVEAVLAALSGGTAEGSTEETTA